MSRLFFVLNFRYFVKKYKNTPINHKTERLDRSKMELNEKKQNRCNWADAMKLLGMCCVFILHSKRCGEYDALCRHVFASLFFIPAGVFAEKSLTLPFREFLKNNFRRLVVPYFILGIIAAVCERICDPCSFRKLLLGVLYGGRDLLSGGAALWFLPALFCVRLYFYICKKTAQKLSCNARWQTFYLIIFCSIICASFRVIQVYLMKFELLGPGRWICLPWSADWAGVYLSLYLIGYLFADWFKNISWSKCNFFWKIIWIFCISLVIIALVKPEIFSYFVRIVVRYIFRGNYLGFNFFVEEVFCAMPFTLGIFAIAKLLNHIDITGKFGRDTLYYCGMEMPFYLCMVAITWFCNRFFPQITFEPMQWHCAIYVAVEWLLVICLLTPVSKKFLGKLF